MKVKKCFVVAALGFMVFAAGCRGNVENSPSAQPSNTSVNNTDEAKEIALADAGLKEEDIRNISIRLDRDGTRTEYEVEFTAGNKDYEYEIDALDGMIISKKIDTNDYYEPTPEPAVTENIITEEQAKTIALTDANFLETEVINLKVKLDRDEIRTEYEVEFDAGNKEYDYEIDALDGRIISKKIDINDDYVPTPEATPTPEPTPTLTLDPTTIPSTPTPAPTSTTIPSTPTPAPTSTSIPSTPTPAPTSTTIPSTPTPAPTSTTVPSTPTPAPASKTITKEEAKKIALKDAGLTEAEIVNLTVKLDRDDGRTEYEVEFDAAGKEYDYDIDALNGNILSKKVDIDDDYIPTPAPTSTSIPSTPTPAPTSAATSSKTITKEEAKKIALKDAGLTEAEVVNLTVKLDRDDGRTEYEVEFDAAGKEYDYDIDASNGNILSRKIEIDDDYIPTPAPTSTTVPSTPTPAPTSAATLSKTITKEEAKKIALKDAGLTEAEVVNLTVKLDRDDGRTEYEVEFDAAGKEYDYDIDASNGNILSRKIEIDDDYIPTPAPTSTTVPSTPTPAPTSSAASSKIITKEEAKEIALKDAGLTEAQVRNLKIKLDKDDGRTEYEIEFDAGRTEYEYEIDASDGRILSKDIDIDD